MKLLLIQALRWCLSKPLRWGAILLTAVIVSLTVYTWGLHTDLRATTAELAQAKSAAAGVAAKLAKQNRAVQALTKRAQRQAAAVQKARQAAGKVRIVYRDQVHEIEKMPVPQTCQAAVDWARDHAGDLAHQWEGGE